jgi:hypothetical protein
MTDVAQRLRTLSPKAAVVVAGTVVLQAAVLALVAWVGWGYFAYETWGIGESLLVLAAACVPVAVFEAAKKLLAFELQNGRLTVVWASARGEVVPDGFGATPRERVDR